MQDDMYRRTDMQLHEPAQIGDVSCYYPADAEDTNIVRGQSQTWVVEGIRTL